jgi:hypothetical protein
MAPASTCLIGDFANNTGSHLPCVCHMCIIVIEHGHHAWVYKCTQEEESKAQPSLAHPQYG